MQCINKEIISRLKKKTHNNIQYFMILREIILQKNYNPTRETTQIQNM